MAAPPSKRQRSSTSGASTSAPPLAATTFIPLIISLPSKTTQIFLLHAALKYPDIANLITSEHTRLTAAKSPKSIDFDHLSKSAWKALNVTYSSMKSSRQFHMAGEASEDVQSCIKTIAKKLLQAR
ncbi:hypothetical protein MMC12_003469 [Toensbergia leucococca]|nr:hypothetical protein [Toensbergia leucococca]